MSQHDYNIANQGFPNFRSDLNNALGAIATNNSGSTAPTTTFAHQWWLDTSTTPNTLRIRNADNDAWVVIGTVDQSTDKFKLTPADGISTDTISELTSAAGVTIDSVLLKDGGVTVSDGTVSAPTVTNTGDTNTGIYFPAADEVAVTAGGSVAAAFNSHQFMGMRNRIINGDMRIDQRNAGASVTPTANQYLVDRWQAATNVTSKFSVQQSSTAPTGFVNSMIATSLSAYSIGASELCALRQSIEGTNVADLAWGTANAKSITISFWVRSSLTGTFGGSIMNSAADYSYPFTYTISSANTYEYKTVTVAGPTAGTWLTTTGIGLSLLFGLGVGTSFSGTAGSWAAAGYYGATGATSVVGTNGATFYITGVQLEVGSTATPFERRPYGTELALCQRYYEKTYSQGTVAGTGTPAGALIGIAYTTAQISAQWSFKQTKRTAPTLTLYSYNGTAGSWSSVSANVDFTVSQPWGVGDSGFARLDSTGMTANAGYWGHAIASAEL